MENNKEKHLKNIKKIIENLHLLKISLNDIEMIQYEYNGRFIDNYYCEVSIYGGLNGHGNWSFYLNQIQQLLSQFYDPQIIEIKTDVVDDVWDLKFSIRGYEE